ncbi:MAG: pseudouridine synthase [Pseudomonadota bacterium]
MRKSAAGQGRSQQFKTESKQAHARRQDSGSPATKPRADKASPRAKAGHTYREPESAEDRMRIAKAIAAAGLCSRRDAERWIADGRVTVNGATISSPALDIGPADEVVVDGKPLPVREPAQMWRYYKPKGLVTTHRDPQGRPTVFANLPPHLPRVISIGRLDFNTEGLLLLTTDGNLARHLELPSTGWMRRYRVRAHGRITQAELTALKDGCTLDGIRYGPIEAELDSMQGGNCWISIGLREGKNREVRKILASLGLQVNRLIRLSFGPFQLLDLKPGEAEPVKRRVLIDQLGRSVAKQFGLEAPQILKPRLEREAAAPRAKLKTEQKGGGKSPRAAKGVAGRTRDGKVQK